MLNKIHGLLLPLAHLTMQIPAMAKTGRADYQLSCCVAYVLALICCMYYTLNIPALDCVYFEPQQYWLPHRKMTNKTVVVHVCVITLHNSSRFPVSLPFSLPLFLLSSIPLSPSELRGGSWQMTRLVKPDELGRPDEWLREQKRKLKLSPQDGEWRVEGYTHALLLYSVV